MSQRRPSTLTILLATSLAVGSLAAVVVPATTPPAHADTSVSVTGPPGSQRFGNWTVVLPNGNYVVTDPNFDMAGVADVGAVHLIDGSTNQIISTLTGSTAGDNVGVNVVVVGTSDFVVSSSYWANGGAPRAGAVTWIDGTVGLSGQVSAANSLVGTHTLDAIGTYLSALPNGNYVTGSSIWDNVGAADAGAVTWGDGHSGVHGVVSVANSLVGTTPGDSVGRTIETLTNGNYAVGSQDWDDGVAVNVGAATFGNGASGTAGPVTVANSLIGSRQDDAVGERVYPLTNGNYVVQSRFWDLGATVNAGAATWQSGFGPGAGVVSAGNSLIGTTTSDFVGTVTPLTNGNYVVVTTSWDLGGIANVGAVTWGSGAGGTVGAVSPANSFVGAADGDGLDMNVKPLSGNRYVILDRSWDDGATVNVGAATLRSGTGPAPGTPSSAISLIGSMPNDNVGSYAVELANGNYVVGSTFWRNPSTGAQSAGATTWGSGVTGAVGPVSATNSLIGDQPFEQVGGNIVALTNGHYMVATTLHDEGAMVDVGAVTWRPGDRPEPATITAQNSLMGTAAGQQLAAGGMALPDGDFLMLSPSWDNGSTVDVGAVTRLSGSAPDLDPVSPANSLVGSATLDSVGTEAVLMSDGSYVIMSPQWHNGGTAHVGAVTWVHGRELVGRVTTSNSDVGTVNDITASTRIDRTRFTVDGSLVVSRPLENRVSLIRPTEFVPLTPARLADTRPTYATVDGQTAGTGLNPAGSTLEVVVTGRGGVASDADAVALNVTAVDSLGDGFVTVHPCGEARPLASNLNFAAGAIVPNAVTARVGAEGKVCIFTSQSTHLVVDVNGYFPTSASYVPTNPARLLDTRGEPTVDGQQQGPGKLTAGAVLELQVTGRAGVPTDAGSVSLNVTVAQPDGPGFITVFPCGLGLPVASNLNFVAGSIVANLVVSDIGSDGRVCLYTSQNAHLVADLNGWFPARSRYHSVAPARLLETRPGLPTVDGQSAGIGVRQAGSVTGVPVLGRAGVPADAASVVLNVTTTEAVGAGFVTVYPCGIDPPLASNLNFVAGGTVPNATIVKVGAAGQVCLFNSQGTQLVVDITGYIPA